MKHTKRIITLLALVVVIWMTGAYDISPMQTEMLNDFNEFRTQLNLKILPANSKLMAAAQAYACKMVSTNYFGHIEADWTRPWDRAKDQWYMYQVGENLINTYRNTITSDEALQLWIDSPGHYRNMISKNWIESGFWQCGWYWVQMFGVGNTIDEPIPSTDMYLWMNTTNTTTGTTTYIIYTWEIVSDMDDEYSYVYENNEVDENIDDLMESWSANAEYGTSELHQSVSWMYNNGLTIFSEPESFMAENWLRRDEATKFFVQYAKEVMWKSSDTSKAGCEFTDLSSAWSDLKDLIKESCQLGLFQGYKWKFMPTQQLTNAQVITVFIRLIDGYKDESWSHFANEYYVIAHGLWLLEGMDLDYIELFDSSATRGEVAQMLFRGKNQ